MRLSKKEHDGILKEISESVNAGPDLIDKIDRIRQDYDESLSGTPNQEWMEKYMALSTERDNLMNELNETKRLYRERFFSGVAEEVQQTVDNQKKDSPKGIRELFNVEGEEVL